MAARSMLFSDVDWTKEGAIQQFSAQDDGEISKANRERGVPHNAEFDRILSLPKRSEEISDERIAALTLFFKTQENIWLDQKRATDRLVWEALPKAEQQRRVLSGVEPPEKPQALRPLQARSIQEIWEESGEFNGVGVGHGKFLISMLGIRISERLGLRRFNADGTVTLEPLERSVLFVPANLYGQTLSELERLRTHWDLPRLHPNGSLKVISYEQLSRTTFAQALEDFRPQVIVCDEIHKLKDPRSARTRRYLRYFRLHPETVQVGLSGSSTRKTPKDMHHLAWLSLPRHCPLPGSRNDLETWHFALAEGVKPFQRVNPGALERLLDADALAKYNAIEPRGVNETGVDRNGNLVTETEQQDLKDQRLSIIRQGYRDRLRSTPGFIMSTEGSLSTSLVFSEREVEVPEIVKEAFEKYIREWTMPNGEEIDSALSLWRHAREVAAGFFYIWSPPAPQEWLYARNNWNKYVRYVLHHNRQNLDSPLEVANAVDLGNLDGGAFGGGDAILKEWRDIRDTFEPNPIPVWMSDFLVVDAEKWAFEDPENPLGVGRIIWVEHTAVGEALAARGRLKYFGGGSDGDAIREHAKTGLPCVASIQAHGTGKNLQTYNKMLVLGMPTSGSACEQLIGRLHRQGQEAEEITIETYLHCRELYDGFLQARRDARYIEDITGSAQKLCFATVASMKSRETVDALVQGGDSLWRTQKDR